MSFKGLRPVTGIALLLLLNASCIQTGKRGSGSGLTAVVDVIGMEQGDQALEGIAYTLVCNQGANNEYKVKGTPKQGTNSVEFPDRELKIGDSCGMDITATQQVSKDTQDPFKWLATTNGKLIAGLFYSSNFAVVEVVKDNAKAMKYLKLELHKVYGFDYRDPFNADLQLTFAKEDGAIIPANSGVLASVHCFPTGQNTEAKRFQETTLTMRSVSGKTDDRKFSFKFSAAKMQNTTCDRVTVAIDNILLYEGTMTNVAFTNPKTTDKGVAFGPFVVNTMQESYGAVNCLSRDQDACVSVRFDENAPIWFAEIRVRNMTDQSIQDIVITNSSGFIPDSHGNTVDLSLDLSAAAGRYKFYQSSAANDILTLNYEPNALQTALGAKEIAPSQLANNRVTQLSHIYTHGFKTVSEGGLNDLNDARWFALVSASNGKEQKRFLVSGGAKYFFSAKKPATTMYFIPDFYRENLAPSNDGYRTYALKNEGLSQSCNVTLDGFRQDLGQQPLSILAAGNSTDINQCEVTDVNKLKFLANGSWILAPRYYIWGWHKTAL